MFRVDLTADITTELTVYGGDVRCFALSADGTVLAVAYLDGLVRVGSPTNDEPHLLFSHAGMPTSIAIDPQRRWIATTSDEEIRLWPMPDLSAPPLHTLPYEELLAKLRSLTNVRLVESTSFSLDENDISFGFDIFTGLNITDSEGHVRRNNFEANNGTAILIQGGSTVTFLNNNIVGNEIGMITENTSAVVHAYHKKYWYIVKRKDFIMDESRHTSKGRRDGIVILDGPGVRAGTSGPGGLHRGAPRVPGDDHHGSTYHPDRAL